MSNWAGCGYKQHFKLLVERIFQIVISWIFAFYEEVMTEREFSHEFLQLGVIFKLFNSCPVRINLLGMK